MAHTKPASNTEHSAQRMQNSSYDTDFGVLVRETLIYNPVASNLVRATGNSRGETVTGSPTVKMIIRTNSGNSNLDYIGKADIGTATSANSWQIQRLDSTTNLDILWADGDAKYNNIWDNRESISFS